MSQCEDLVHFAKDFIHSGYRDPISVVDVAEACGTSVRTLQLAFRKTIGMTPRECLNTVRLEAARSALENPGDDQSARVEKYLAWANENNVRLNDLGAVVPALGLFDSIDPTVDARLVWHPDSADYRKTAAFKEVARAHFLHPWKEFGFPPQCRQLDGEDFECD